MTLVLLQTPLRKWTPPLLGGNSSTCFINTSKNSFVDCNPLMMICCPISIIYPSQIVSVNLNEVDRVKRDILCETKLSHDPIRLLKFNVANQIIGTFFSWYRRGDNDNQSTYFILSIRCPQELKANGWH